MGQSHQEFKILSNEIPTAMIPNIFINRKHSDNNIVLSNVLSNLKKAIIWAQKNEEDVLSINCDNTVQRDF
jgi:hypothetical protein